jgi:hypothetical protein
MTRQDYEAIAKVLDANHADLALVGDFADMLEENNARFDRGLFFKAATGNVEKDANHTVRSIRREVTGHA